MDNKKKKYIFSLILMIAIIILIAIGSTFAYFSAMVSSEENAVNLSAAVYKLELLDDTSLIKTRVIPSAEKYVDMSLDRLDENGNFIKPYEQDGKMIKDHTVCIDDNLSEICSLYTFTIQNPMTDMDLPLYITLNPAINTFENLYYKVIERVYDSDSGKYKINELIGKTHLVDDREYTLDSNGNKVYSEGNKISPAVLEGINTTLNKAPSKNEPTEVTYSIVLWVDETNSNQTIADSGKVYAGTLNVNASGVNGNGISGVFSAGGVDNN